MIPQNQAVTVGSEALYRRDMNVTELVKCIVIVNEELSGLGMGSVPVVTADSWINGANGIVVQACDIVLANAFSV
jgi:exo-beta-1,3-glucanase (GH17 family)